MAEPEYIGYIRYKGKPLEKGYFDARKSAEALLGFDEALRYFVGKEDTTLAKFDYAIPVKIRQGSWQALIPQDIDVYIKPAATLIATAYFATAAKKMADNDFKNMGFVPVFRKGLEAIQWMLRIGKHLGTLSKRTFTNLRWRKGNQEVGLPNADDIYLWIPRYFLDLFEQIPSALLKKIASPINEDIALEVGLRGDEKDAIEALDVAHRAIFCPNDEILFPELKHDMDVSLEGLVTRGNENANSIGFEYEEHILTCYPNEGSIVRFKESLFLYCRMKGKVTRADKFGGFNELRPKIVFSKLKAIRKERARELQPKLFDDES